MPNTLLMRLEGPMMSFGGAMVDRFGVTDPCPSLSMLTGLLGNALGWDHRDVDALQALQARLRFACRQDRAGRLLSDYQTVDLSQPFLMSDQAWTTRGALEPREGARSSREGTHIRQRDFWADAAFTLAVRLTPPDDAPTLDQLAEALAAPARPLFLGRKCCPPSAPLLLGQVDAPNLVAALQRAPLAAPRGRRAGPALAAQTRRMWWPQGEFAHPDAQARPVCDARDWRNQIHTGERWVLEHTLPLEPAALDPAPTASP